MTDERIKFVKNEKQNKRSFALRKNAIDEKTISLMSALSNFVIVDPVTNNEIPSSQCASYPFDPTIVYEVKAPATKEEDKHKWFAACTLEELRRSPGHRIRKQISGRDVLLFDMKSLSGRGVKQPYSAIDAVCYHFGGPLDEGDIEDLDGQTCVVCPWHRYPISLDTGESLFRLNTGQCSSKGVKHRLHKVKVEGNQVFIQLNSEAKEYASDAYAMMGLSTVANQKAAPRNLHSDRNETRIMDPFSFKEFVLKEVIPVNFNTKKFRFQIPGSTSKIDIPIGYHITARITDGHNGTIIRDYTPIADEPGYFDLLIKVYEKGPMSQYIHNMKVGQTLSMKGPSGRWEYVPNQSEIVCMIAGGTGITPMFQVIQAIINNKEDNTFVSLLFANTSEVDILLKDELDKMALTHPKKLKILHLLSKPRGPWPTTGHINLDLFRSWIPKDRKRMKTLVCGTDGFCEVAISSLTTLGVDKGDIHMF